eukprot:646440-Amphidinium_carterae.2
MQRLMRKNSSLSRQVGACPGFEFTDDRRCLAEQSSCKTPRQPYGSSSTRTPLFRNDFVPCS